VQTSAKQIFQCPPSGLFLWVKQMKTNSKAGTSQSDVTNAGASDAQAEAQANTQAQAVDVLAIDEHAGQPGSYVFDPATGKRSKVD